MKYTTKIFKYKYRTKEELLEQARIKHRYWKAQHDDECWTVPVPTNTPTPEEHMERTYWMLPTLDKQYDADGYEIAPNHSLYQVEEAVGANLVASLTADGFHHMPTLDLDIPAELIASSTPGHSHLYIETAMSWRQYRKLLEVLAEVGIIEQGYADASIAHGMSTLRKPGQFKPGVQVVVEPQVVKGLKKLVEEQANEIETLKAALVSAQQASWG